jgi:hypothetical protein
VVLVNNKTTEGKKKMNAMKKWLVVGLIGLSSVGVSMATTTVFDDFSVNRTPEDPPAGNDIVWWGPFNADFVGVDDTRYGFNYGNGSEGEGMGFTFPPGTSGVRLNNFVTGDATLQEMAVGWNFYTKPEHYVTGYQSMTVDFGDSSFGAGTTVWLYWGQFRTEVTEFADQGSTTIDWTEAKWENWQTPAGQLSIDDFAAVELLNGIHSYGSYFFIYTEFNGINELGSYVAIDSFTLNGTEQGVPEPETVWMMLAVLGSLAVTFRGHLSDLARRFVKS